MPEGNEDIYNYTKAFCAGVSVGTAVQDVVAGFVVCKAAREQGKGRDVG